MSACFIVYCVRLLSSIRVFLLQPDLPLCFPLCFSCTTLILHACMSAPKGSRTRPTCSHLCLFYTRTCVEQPPPKNPKLKKKKKKVKTTPKRSCLQHPAQKNQLRTDCGVNGQNLWDKATKRCGPIRFPHCLRSQMRVVRCLSVEVFPVFFGITKSNQSN